MTKEMTEGQKKFYMEIQKAVISTEQRCGKEIEKLKAVIELYENGLNEWLARKSLSKNPIVKYQIKDLQKRAREVLEKINEV